MKNETNIYDIDGNIIRKAKRIRADIQAPVIIHRTDANRRHRKKRRSLVKVIHDPQILKRTHLYKSPLCNVKQFSQAGNSSRCSVHSNKGVSQ